MIDLMDQCPTCRFNLGRHCDDNDMQAGQEVTCPDCGDRFRLTEHSDGWEAWYDFHPVEDDGGGGP